MDRKSVTKEVGWETNSKNIFILSSSGKPIFSRIGDEQDLVTTFGLLQAVISIVLDSGDSIKCIRSGQRKVLVQLKESLYFVCVHNTKESDLIIFKQLDFMYRQILLVLTSKVHNVLNNNFSADIRQLLGTDTMRMLTAACSDEISLPIIAFESIKSLTCTKELREDVLFHLKYCVEKSGAV